MFEQLIFKDLETELKENILNSNQVYVDMIAVEVNTK